MNKIFFRLIKLASEYKFWMLSAIFVGFLTVGSSIGLMMTSAYIISKAALHPSIAELQVGIVGVRFFGIARGVFRYIERYISHETTFKLLAKFRVWFYDSVVPLFPSKILKFKSGDLLTRAVNDVENLEHIFVRVIAPPFTALFVMLLIMFLLADYNFIYAIVVLFFFVISGIGVPLLTYRLSKRNGSAIIQLNAKLNELSIDQTQGMGELLLFNQADNFKTELEETQNNLLKLQRKHALIGGLNEALIGLIMSLSVFTILNFAIPHVSEGLLDGVYLSVLVLGVMASFEALFPLPTTVQFWDESIKSAGRLFEITDVNTNDTNKNGSASIPQKHSIIFDRVKFGYSRDTLLYDDLNLTIPERSFTAIVGASGAGKTTIVNLLNKFWEYQAGKILIGNIELKDIPRAELVKLISVLPQKTHLFNLSVKENIRFAKPDSTDEEIIEAAKKANIHNFILSLPDKYNELVGEQGLKLSGGERRRIALARAFLKNSPIFICDEPTADLDTINEKEIMQTLYEYAETKTVLIITHKLFHLENADCIFVMQNGKIIESGKHSELISKRGYYYKMLELEAGIIN